MVADKTKDVKPGLKQARPIYRCLVGVTLTTDRQYYPAGTILDLSHLPDKSRQWFVSQGYFETADGEPENDPAIPVQPCKNC